jgi:hypothetical protein
VKLTLRKIGGVAGPVGAAPRTVDLDALPAGRLARARSLVDAARIFEQPAHIFLPRPQPWDFRYVLDAEDEGRAHHTELHLEAADAPLRALVKWLEDQGPGVSGTPPAP